MPIERVVGLNMVIDNKASTNRKTNTRYPTKKIMRITKTKKIKKTILIYEIPKSLLQHRSNNKTMRLT